jgi:hypothetical protein
VSHRKGDSGESHRVLGRAGRVGRKGGGRVRNVGKMGGLAQSQREAGRTQRGRGR